MELVLIYSDTRSFEPLQSVLPVSLISIMGKPLIQHQLELSYSRGIRRCTIIASSNMEKIRDFCSDGSRFGVQVKLVTAAPSGEEIESLLRHRNLLSDDCLVLAGRTLANLPIEELRLQHNRSGKRISVIRHAKTNEILGVLTSPPSPGSFFENDRGSLRDAASRLMTEQAADVNIIDASFSHFVCRNLPDVLRLTASVLKNPSDYIYNTHFAQQEQGIHLGHHTLIHPSAVLHPPVAIGDFCQVLEGATIGPFTTISSGCIVAKGAVVSNSIVSPGSYVGEMMEVKDAIVVGSTLVQPLPGTKVLVSDPLLLDSIDVRDLKYIVNSFTHKAAALGLLLALAPAGVSVAALSRLRKNRTLTKVATVGHGDVKDESDIRWLPRFNRLEFSDRDLPLSWYPSLLNVVKGEMRFTGPRPISPDDMTDETTVAGAVRFTVPPGLFPVDALFEKHSHEADLAEIIYTKKQGLLQDIRCVAATLTAPLIGQQNAKRLAGL